MRRGCRQGEINYVPSTERALDSGECIGDEAEDAFGGEYAEIGVTIVDTNALLCDSYKQNQHDFAEPISQACLVNVRRLNIDGCYDVFIILEMFGIFQCLLCM